MRTRLFSALLLAAVVLSMPVAAHAEGPGVGGRRVMVDGDVGGDYRLRVVTSPTPPRVDNLYLEIRVIELNSSAVVTDAVVEVTAEHTEGENDTLSATATHDIAPIPTEYAAHLPVGHTGVYRVQVMVEGEAGTAETEFLIRISGGTAITGAIAVGLPVAGLLLLVLFFVYLQRQADSVEPGNA